LSQVPNIQFSQLVCAASAVSGGAGTVREVITPRQFGRFSGLYVKEFNSTRVNNGTRAKLLYQIQHAPGNLVSPRFRLAWPIALMTTGTTRLGFLMPGAFSKSIPLEELIVPNLASNVDQSFRDKFDLAQPISLLNRVKAALNICAALQMFYSGGEYQIIDMKPSNMLITSGGEITLVDLDSIQILERGSVKFEGVDGTVRYTPPEGLVDRTDARHKNIHWDEFSLAIILYQIMIGAPPHAASFGGAFANCTEMRDKIKAGLFVFGRHASIITNRSALHDTFLNLPGDLQRLFYRALDLGHDNPPIRPSVTEWGAAIHRAVSVLEGQLKTGVRRNPVNPSRPPGAAVIAGSHLARAFAFRHWRALAIGGGVVGLALLSISGNQTRVPSPAPQQVTPQPAIVAPPPGYEWVDQSRGLKRWIPGSKYGLSWPHVIAAQQEGKWTTERGYQFQNNIAVWVPGSPYGPPWPHVIASDEEGKWATEPGYRIRNNNVVWVPGLAYGPRWPHVIASDDEGIWEPEPGYEFGNNREGEYDVRPIPTPTSYEQGLADRTAWEQWFASLSGDYQGGAYWWAGQRSSSNPGTCNILGATPQFAMACEAAKARLTPSDMKSKSSPEYKRGWNEYSGPVVQPQVPDPGAGAIVPYASPSYDPQAGAADRLNSQELRRLNLR
jgi:hypothetical protein